MSRAPLHAPSNRLAVTALALAATFCAVYAALAVPCLLRAAHPPATAALLWAKLLAEMAFSFPAASMILVSLAYLLGRADRPEVPATAEPGGEPLPPVGVVYLCCGDLDRDALHSLRQLRYDGPLHLVVQDDMPGGDPVLDALVPELEADERFTFHLLRRPQRGGGKPGALNYVLEQVGDRCEHFLVCDNDSVAVDPDCLPKLLAPMRDPHVAVVQARNVPAADVHHCGVNRILSRAIDVFHLFLSVARRYGWTPFVGHNALLRTRALVEAGGFTPGCFADDIDVTIRLNLHGYRAAYAGHVHFGEKHPPSYAAFRMRSYKWAFGSMQVLRRHLGAVLTTRRLKLGEKWGMLHFVAFYTLQTFLLGYVCMLFLIGPFVLSGADFDLTATVVAGSVIPVLIFLPVIVFALRHGRVRELPAFIGTCWLGYGATDVPTARGTFDGLRGGERRWTPTNSIADGGVDLSQVAESLFGVALLVVPMLHFPLLLLSPLTIVIAAKFLFIPTMSVLYRDKHLPPARLQLRPLVGVLVLAGISITMAALADPPRAAAAGAAGAQGVTVAGGRILVDGQPYLVKGVHYGPWRPGTGPGKADYPEDALLDEDLALVAAAHANSVLVYDPPRRLLDVAWKHGLRVQVALWLDWNQFATPGFAAFEQQAVARVTELHDHPAVLGWMVGHEVPVWVVAQHGEDAVQTALRDLHDAIDAVDGSHFVTHGNWPSTRQLELGFLDVCAFNVYPLWPPEVVAMGYERFVREVLRPIAGDRPLLIGEFGVNSLEAGELGQAQMVRECWDALVAAGAAGGFVFEFADEWWKNYGNPRTETSYWDREPDPDDHLTHDRDPEEHYGLVTGEREPKAAYHEVAAMFSGRRSAWPSLAVYGLVGAALLSFGVALWHTRRRRGPAPAAALPQGATP